MYTIYMLIVLVFPSAVVRVNSQEMDLPLVAENSVKSNRPVTCTLPPYPENGGYVVVNEPDAKPGDLFLNVTLIQYIMDEDQLTEIDSLVCLYGEWYLKVLKYESERTHLNVTTCPLLCLNNLAARISAQPSKPLDVIQDNTKQNSCILPARPDNGWYIAVNNPNAKVGAALDAVLLRYACNYPFTLIGNKEVYCFNGIWYDSAPKCIYESPGYAVISGDFVETNDEVYHCVLPRYPNDGKYNAVNLDKTSPGEKYGAVNLHYTCNSNTKMVGDRSLFCVRGRWSGLPPKCVRCGVITPLPEDPDTNSTSTSVLPWHVAIYDTSSSPYQQICAGSIVTTNLVVSAILDVDCDVDDRLAHWLATLALMPDVARPRLTAHCFWSESEGALAASRFAVAAGKVYRHWDDPRDDFAQTANVREIAIPPAYRGRLNYFANDIALVFLKTPLDYNEFVTPVCIDFDTMVEEEQLKTGNLGIVAGWGTSDDDTEASTALDVKNITFVDTAKCASTVPAAVRPFVTSDKLCAGRPDATACRVDAGGGLSFPSAAGPDASPRYYLRGVISALPDTNKSCNDHTVTTFTQVSAHERFLQLFFKLAVW